MIIIRDIMIIPLLSHCLTIFRIMGYPNYMPLYPMILHIQHISIYIYHHLVHLFRVGTTHPRVAAAMATPSGKCCRHWLPGVAHGRRPDFESLVCHKCSWRNKHCSQPERNTLEFQTKKWKYSRSWWCVYIYIVCIYLVINKWYKVLLYIAIKLYIVYIYYIYNINIYII